MKTLVKLMLVMVSSSALAGPFDKKPPVEIAPVPAPVIVAPAVVPIAPVAPASIVIPVSPPPKSAASAASAPASVKSTTAVKATDSKAATAAPLVVVVPANPQIKLLKPIPTASTAANSAPAVVKKTAPVAQVSQYPTVFKRPIAFTPSEGAAIVRNESSRAEMIAKEKLLAKTPDERIAAGNLECNDNILVGFICREKVRLVACNSDWNDGTKPGATKCIQPTRGPVGLN